MKKATPFIQQRKDGSWWARVRFIDPVTGKTRDLQRRAKNKAEARDLRDKLAAELTASEGRTLLHDRSTFNDLAEYYEENYLQEPTYVEGRKVAGLRSARTQRLHLADLRDYFGGRRLRSLSFGDLRTFRAKRLATPTRSGSARTIASVNREMALLRRMLNIAVREGWLVRSPFDQGERLISLAEEKSRERILTLEEERTLLRACDAPGRSHLKPILICALDTGFRQGEILKLQWKDVSLAAGELTVQAFNSKTMRERRAGITPRLRAELEDLLSQHSGGDDALVFGIQNNVKRSFASVRAAAGLTELRFHDLRHTFATRLARANMPIMEVGRLLGHSQLSTTYRYVNADSTTLVRASEALHAFQVEESTGTDHRLASDNGEHFIAN
jgi:integrase